MPLLVSVARSRAWFVPGWRSPRQCTREPLARVGIPFAVATLTIIPIHVMIGLSVTRWPLPLIMQHALVMSASALVTA